MCTSRTLAGASIFLIASNFDKRDLSPWLLTHKPRYSVSVRQKDDLSAFTFNPESDSFCNTFYNAYKW